VVLREPGSATAEALRNFAIARLVPHKVPSSVVLVRDLARNAAGKAQREGLADVLHDALHAGFVPPRNREEVLVAAVFAEVLARPDVSALDHFFHSGGDSLLAAQVIARLRDRTDIDLGIRALFEAPVVEQLANRLRETALLAPASPDGGFALVRRARNAAAVA